MANEPVQLLEVQGRVADRSQVLVLEQELRGGLPEGSLRSYTEHRGLPGLFQSPCQVFLRFRELAFASAFANASASVALVDVPDSASIDKAWRYLSSHFNNPFRWAGRPLRRLYCSTQASSSRRSKAMPCVPIGISVSDGRTSALNRLRSMPR